MATANCGFGDPHALMLHGPTLYVMVGFDDDYRVDTGARPNLPTDQVPALVDTGGYDSCIDSELAMNLGLPIVDRQTVAGISGPDEVNVHLAQIYIPDLNVTVIGPFVGVHLTAGGQPRYALIGRTFLRHCKMTYHGQLGAVTIGAEWSASDSRLSVILLAVLQAIGTVAQSTWSWHVFKKSANSATILVRRCKGHSAWREVRGETLFLDTDGLVRAAGNYCVGGHSLWWGR